MRLIPSSELPPRRSAVHVRVQSLLPVCFQSSVLFRSEYDKKQSGGDKSPGDDLKNNFSVFFLVHGSEETFERADDGDGDQDGGNEYGDHDRQTGGE